jgi:hypothetical protein
MSAEDVIGANDELGRKLLAIARAELAEVDYALRLTNERLTRLNDRRAVILAQIWTFEGTRKLDDDNEEQRSATPPIR